MVCGVASIHEIYQKNKEIIFGEDQIFGEWPKFSKINKKTIENYSIKL